MATPITDFPIHIWRPMKDGQPFLAMIGSLPMIFRAPTALGAKRAAEEWRLAEVEKERQRQELSRQRSEALKAARAARAAAKERAA